MSEAPGRRAVLASVSGALAAGLAGCSSATSQEFAASPVRLPEAVRENLRLAELFAESDTTTRERTVGGQDVEVTVTNQFAGYGRWNPEAVDAWWVGARPTLVDRFVGGGAETPGAGNLWSSINAVASELGLGQSNPSYVAEDVAVDPDRVTLVVPERARHDGAVRLEELMALHHAEALGVDELTSRGGNNYLVAASSVLPDRGFAPSDKPDWTPDERWVAGHEGHWLPEDPADLDCIVCLGEQSPESVFGLDEMPGRRLDQGESVATENTLVFAPAPKEYPSPDDWSPDPTRVFDAGYPSPLGGPSYGLGVLATPNAEVAGESVNPLARIEVGDLLTREMTGDLLARAGLTDADAVEWLRGPEKTGVVTEWMPQDTVSVLESDVGLESFAGVVGGAEGPWAVAVHAAKAPGDDVVVPAAVHRRPVGTPDGRELVGDGTGFVDRRWTTRAVELTGQVFASLVATEDA